MEFRAAVTAAVDALEPYLRAAESGHGPAVVLPALGAVSESLELRRWIREGGMDTVALGRFLESYLALTTRVGHPAELAHQVAVPDVPAAIGDLVHGITNNPMGIYEMGPAAATIEVEVVAWMLAQIGFDPAAAGGVLTHGGSLANLTALLAARARAAPQAWQCGAPSDLSLLATPAAHYSLSRAAAILGLGTDAIVALATDDLDRLDPARMHEGLTASRTAGRRPFALVAAACATGTGLHDDVAAAAAFCREHGIWLHVDAAHGASGLLSPRHRALLAGIEQADSVIWDAHKLLRVAGLCAAVLVRDATALDHAFQQQASYLFYDRDSEGVDLLSRTVECTKAALGLKLFLELAARGERGLGDDVAARYDVAHEAWELLCTHEAFSCPYEPETNILCFRADGDDNHQLLVRDRLMAAGDVHLSSTLIGGRRHLRIVVNSPATTRSTLERTIEQIAACSRAIRDRRTRG
jgi:L-2,4-diaminobutyrate decarboxylase